MSDVPWVSAVRQIWIGAAAMVWGAVFAADASASTLEIVRQSGAVRCGSEDSPVSAVQRPAGGPQGFDVDLCRAIAAAVFGDSDRVEIIPLNHQLRIPALVQGEVDVLFANLTWTYGRDVREGIEYAAIVLYDGQSFLGYESDGVGALADRKDAVVCVQKGTTTERNLESYIRTTSPSWKALVMQSDEGTREAFINRRCTILTNDRSFLAGWRALSGLFGFHLFPDVISKEPLSAAVRAGDNNWLEIIRWVVFALIAAEEAGITQANADAIRAGPRDDPAQAPLIGAEPGFGKPLGLGDDWAFQAIRQVGNYGEIFERNLGRHSRLNMERGLNRLWTEGGLLYPPPLR